MIDRIATDILIIGGGGAGMSAALAASSKTEIGITIVDDNPRLGGQIWRAELGKIKSRDATDLIHSIDSGRIKVVNNAQAFASKGNARIMAETPRGVIEAEFGRLIVATGARERFLPFPGWTLPNVFGAAGLQALVKGGVSVKNKRIVVAGTGPLLIVVAEFLKAKGASVLAVCEQAPSAKVNRFAFGLLLSPSKLKQTTAMRAKLFGVPYLTGCWITAAKGLCDLEAVEIVHKGKRQMIECDMLACGFDLVPNTELASVLGCEIDSGFVTIDDFQRTTVENVYCAGEPTGIGGVEASLVEGKIAGFAASGDLDSARHLFGTRSKTRKFAASLAKAFELRPEVKRLAQDDTIVCRCEDVEYGKLASFDEWRSAKLQTRCGMGSCQGRICGPAAEVLFGWKGRSIRPPIFPVTMENL